MKFNNIYNKKYKKENGIFYTPQDIASIMAEHTKKFDDGKGIWLDPCCGAGILAITLASIQDDPINFINNRLVINEKDKTQLDIAINNFIDKFGIAPKSYNQNFLEYDFQYDYIIMNPPYYKYQENDIYAYFLNKACESKGFVSINPTSFTNGSKFKKTRTNILNFESIKMYHFDTIPGCIFEDAEVRSTIIICHNLCHERKTTGQIRWQTKERKNMLNSLDSYIGDGLFTEDIFYKTIPNTKIFIHDNTLSNYCVEKSDYPIYITSTPRYYITGSSKKLDRNGQIEIFLKDKETYEKALIMLNSSYLYWWWRTSDSSMSLTKNTLLTLPWINFKYNPSIINLILESENFNKVYKKNAGKMQENIKHGKDIISELNIEIFGNNELIKLHD